MVPSPWRDPRIKLAGTPDRVAWAAYELNKRVATPARERRATFGGYMMEKFWIWLTWKLPRDLVYWCAIRLGSAATVPPYGNQVVPELLYLDALKRWEEGK